MLAVLGLFDDFGYLSELSLDILDENSLLTNLRKSCILYPNSNDQTR